MNFPLLLVLFWKRRWNFQQLEFLAVSSTTLCFGLLKEPFIPFYVRSFLKVFFLCIDLVALEHWLLPVIVKDFSCMWDIYSYILFFVWLGPYELWLSSILLVWTIFLISFHGVSKLDSLRNQLMHGLKDFHSIVWFYVAFWTVWWFLWDTGYFL